VDSFPDQLLLGKCGSAGNRTQTIRPQKRSKRKRLLQTVVFAVALYVLGSIIAVRILCGRNLYSFFVYEMDPGERGQLLTGCGYVQGVSIYVISRPSDPTAHGPDIDLRQSVAC
jgi:hypothetical protein